MNDDKTSESNNDSPFARLVQDWKAAKEAKDPNAPFVTLMTVDHGRPTGRIVGLRDIVVDNGTLLVYTNSMSPKFQQLSATPHFELLLFWTRPQMLQYRLSGSTWSKVDEAEMKRQWQLHKPHGSKLLDYFYQQHQGQSTVLAGGRAQFCQEMQAIRNQFTSSTTTDQSEVPFQSVCIGLLFQPKAVEEWRGSVEDRLHERYLYKKDGDSWTKQTLVP